MSYESHMRDAAMYKRLAEQDANRRDTVYDKSGTAQKSYQRGYERNMQLYNESLFKALAEKDK